MRVYIATTYSNRARQIQIARRLKDQLDIELTHDWTTFGAMTPDRMEEAIELERLEEQGVRDADALILILPSAKGSQTEFGIAIGLNKPIFILVDQQRDLISEDGRFCVFHHRPDNKIVYSEIGLLIELQRLKNGLTARPCLFEEGRGAYDELNTDTCSCGCGRQVVTGVCSAPKQDC